jgi:hypothetical protein
MAVELPPPYQELAKELEALPAGATVEDAKPIFEKLESLPQPTLFSAEELENFTNLPESSELEKASLEKELAQFMSTKVGLAVIQRAAQNAGAQVKKINAMLDELYGKLVVLDAKYQSNFSKDFWDFIASYKKIVSNSRSLASEIAAYGRNYHKIIKKVMADPNTPEKVKIEFLDKFIAHAQDFHAKSETTHLALELLATKFSGFTQQFRDWSSPQMGDLRTKIEEAEKEISRLSKEAKDLRAESQRAVDRGVMATICMGAVCIFCPAALPFVLAGSAMAMTAGAAHALIASKAASDKEKLRATKQKELESYRAELSEYNKTRSDLISLAEKDLAIFQLGIGILTTVWRNAQSDAGTVLEALKTGKQGAASSLAVQLALDEANLNYMVMAQYLDEYALGLVGVESA